MNFNYVKGDLFVHVPDLNYDITIIPHVCNNIGKFGKGFVVPLAKKYPESKKTFIKSFDSLEGKLSDTQFISCDNEKVIVANMVAQEGIGSKKVNGKLVSPIRYYALSNCMNKVKDVALSLKNQNKNVLIACPMFGSGLAGGNWEIIEKMIEEIWVKEIPVKVYCLK